MKTRKLAERRSTVKEVRLITRDEESRIVDLLRTKASESNQSLYSDVADLVVVLLDTGMRLGEALELQQEDINFESNLITVRMSKTDQYRRVPMTKRVADILGRNELNQQKPFTLNVHQIQIAWAWVKSQIEVKDAQLLVMHSLRQTCASRLIKVGVAQDLVEEWLFNGRDKWCRRLAPLSAQYLNNAAKLLEKYED